MDDEFTTYKIEATQQGLPTEFSPQELVEFWKTKKEKVPHWFDFSRHIGVYQPSSAFVERVFSVFQNTITERKERSLIDYINASLMAQINK